MEFTIYFHRKDASSLAFDCDHVRNEILCVFIHRKETDFCQLGVILRGIHFSDPTDKYVRLDDVTHCGLESH